MVSDNMPPNSAPSAHKNLGPTIPSRSSSISSTSNLEKQRVAPHHSTPKPSPHRPDLSHDNLEPILTSLNPSRVPEGTQSPVGSNMRSTSSSRQSQNLLPDSAQVQRWAGLTRSVCNWDGLRKVSNVDHDCNHC
jgi:hypothetical protein